MTNQRKNIDRLFQNKLQNFERSPSEAVWKELQDKLHKKKRRKAIIIWSAAATILIMITSTLLLTVLNLPTKNQKLAESETSVSDSSFNETVQQSKTNNIAKKSKDFEISHQKTEKVIEESNRKSLAQIGKSENLPVSRSKETELQKPKKEQSKTLQQKEVEKKKIVEETKPSDYFFTQEKEQALITKKTEDEKFNAGTKIAQNNSLVNKNEIDKKTRTKKKTDDAKTYADNTVVNSGTEEKSERNEDAARNDDLTNLEEKIIEKNKKLLSAEEDKENINSKRPREKRKKRISLIGQIQPSYSFRRAPITGGSAMSDQAEAGSSRNEKGIWNIGGGIKIDIQASEKLTFRTGIIYSKNGQKSSYVNTISADTDNSSAVNSIREINTSAGTIKTNNPVTNLPVSNEIQVDADPNAVGSQIITESELIQEFENIEIPLAVKYKLIGEKIEINAIGGLSTNLIIDNNVYSGNTNVGKTENINKINFSTDFGISVEYPITKKVKLNIEPGLKYYLNSISNDKNVKFKPYSLGVSTGISIEF